MITYLITGGAGFIGGNFIFYMLERYADIKLVCLDSLTYAGNLKTLEPVMDDPRFEFIRASITDAKAVNAIFEFKSPEVVVNFAAESHVDNSICAPELFMRTNAMGAQTLLEACRRHGVRRFHQVSTDEVYGDLPLEKPELKFDESTPLRPSSPYSASKAASDLLALAYHRTYGLPVTVSRCSNNYGPFQYPEKLIPRMLLSAFDDKPLPVYGNGQNVRDWLHVSDHCRAIDMIISGGRSGEVYNIGGGSERSNIEIVKRVLSALGKGDELITYVADRAGHDLRYAVNSAKLEQTLGWRPAVDFEAGLGKTIEWYLSNERWWRPLLENKEA